MGLFIGKKRHQLLGKMFNSFKKFKYVMSLEQQRRSAQTFPYINQHLFCRTRISLIASILLSFSVFHWKGFLWGSDCFQSKYTGSLSCFFINKHCVSHQICIYACLSYHCASQEGWALTCSPCLPSERDPFQPTGLHFSGDVQWSPALWAAQPVKV